jgi:uncharacterized radical SAM superfamily protein
MDISARLIREIEADSSGARAIKFLSNLDGEHFSELLNSAWNIRQKNFDPVLNCFYPGKQFPAISITGSKCALQCNHCNKHYLTLMTSAETPTKLWNICNTFQKEGKLGCLISGGYNQDAMLPFKEFLPILKQIKNETDLILNVHTGLVNEEIALQLGESKVDIVSFDFVGDEETIQEIYRIHKKPEDYLNSLQFLLESKIPYITPHICIGLRRGDLSGEIRALTLIKSLKPYLIVLLGFIPTVNTPMEDLPPPSPELIAKIIATTRILFPKTPLSLGCMRPGKKLRNQIDIYAIQAGINRIELPTSKTIHYALQQGLQIQKFNTCCAVPLKLLDKKSF